MVISKKTADGSQVHHRRGFPREPKEREDLFSRKTGLVNSTPGTAIGPYLGSAYCLTLKF